VCHALCTCTHIQFPYTCCMYVQLLLSYFHSAMYTAAGEHAKAVEIMGENGWIDKLVISVCNIFVVNH